jgi:ketosteroid isomerase-like protein
VTSPDDVAIEGLIQRYAEAVDHADFDEVASLFEHAVFRSPQAEARGSDEVRELFEMVKLDDHGSPGTWHHVFGIDLTVDGDDATAASFLTAIQDGRPIVAGRYEDVFVRRNGTWRFASRELHTDLVGDMSSLVLDTEPDG